MNFVRLSALVLRARKWFALYYLVVFTLVAILLAVTGRSWVARGSFVPQSRGPSSGLQGLAAQIGVAVPSLDLSQGPAFYSDLLTSSTILGKAVDTVYDFASGSGPQHQTLIDALHASGATPEARREDAIVRLRKSLVVIANPKTGIVSFSVKTSSPILSAAVATRLLSLLNEFNLTKRQSQAAAERRFAERRLDEVRGELRSAEDAEQRFLQQNREYRNSPQLTFENERLTRTVQLQQQLYTSLAQSVEQAKIDEVRDTPVITIVEPPRVPARPESRGIAVLGLSLLVFGTFGGVALIAIFDQLSRGAENDPDAQALRFETNAFFGRLRRRRRAPGDEEIAS